MSTDKPAISGEVLPGLFASGLEYLVDTGQRSVLFLDVMRQRGLQYREHIAETAPHVLNYEVELIVDGRTLPQPVNYALVSVAPPSGVAIDNKRRPFVVIDPRAGHGPGIGGFKADSEIGVAMKAGHPCYFIGFLPEPMPGQTIEDVARAEAVFIERVIALHPEADGKPCVIGNCQAGWAVMILASLRPELFGPLIIAGAPLSYWAGVRGKNPMRYSGGLLGGSWLTALTSDLGGGKFDGAWLVQNFENMNPSNTLWTKQYNVYSKVDSEADRYLEFERWWGGHVNLNAEEIQFIVDELFVGNNLAAGRIKTSDGQTVDLRKISSPIVVFCSKGDNITPPQQALGWILDLYSDVDDIRAYGQTIVYTVHETVGHLGIFVSGGVAKKEHSEFSSNIDLIDVLPPGLYEATFEAKSAETANSDLAGGKWIMRCERRTLDDIRAMGGNTAEDERRFATAARVSEINLSNYRKFVQPWVRTAVAPQMAELMRQWHPLRVSYEAFGGDTVAMKGVARAADKIREQRKPAAEDNPFVAFQETVSKNIVDVLDKWRDTQESLSEALFLGIYGSPVVQAAVGITPNADVSPKPQMSSEHRERLEARIAELKSQVGSGGLRECVIRGLLYVGMSRGMVDERSLEALRRARANDAGSRLTLAQFKKIVREQFFMLLLEPAASLAAIPKLLPPDEGERRAGLEAIRGVLSASAEISGEAAKRLDRVTELFGLAGKIAGEGVIGVGGLIGELDMGIASIEAGEARAGAKYDRLIAAAKAIPPATTIVVHPCDESSLRGAADAAEAGIIKPVLVGPSAKIKAVASRHGIDISAFELVDAPHSEAAATKAVELVHAAKGEMLMKGSLHTDELMRSVTAKAGGLRTERRISHVFVMDVPAYSETIFVTDAAINIFPDLDGKRDIVQNAIDLYTQMGLGTSPRVAILSAVETVTSKIPSTIEAAALCKMADRGQITGGLLDGPLAFDNAIDREAARIKGIKSEVAGRAQILVVPDLEAGNMLAKNLAYFAKADGAGIVLGARVPIVLTSRADSPRSRMASCAVATLYADGRRRRAQTAAA